MSIPPPLKRVTTWRQLKSEAEGLKDFYKRALDVAEDLCIVADMRDELLLSQVLKKHGSLKVHGAFKVSEELLLPEAEIVNDVN